jgi:hypothetical protein
VLFWVGVKTCFLVQSKTKVCCFEFSQGRVYGVKFGSIYNHSPMRGHMGHPEASQRDLENQQSCEVLTKARGNVQPL